jgi:hypothetical protein
MKILVSVILLAVYLAPGFVLPAQAAPGASPVKYQATLLSLYRRSDTILVGRYDRKEDAEITRVEENYSVINTKTSFDISSSLKGETVKFLAINDEEFRYRLSSEENGEPGKEVAFVEDSGSLDRAAEPEPGDTVLLFLKRSDDGKTFEPADYRDGIKKVSSAELSVYTDRIKELNSIFSAKAVSPAAVTSWLVRCTENTATRWDGAYELLQAFRRLDWQQKRRARIVEASATIDDNDPIFDTAKYAEALTGEQKAALANIVLGLDPRPTGTAGSISELPKGDRELIALVKRCGGSVVSAPIVESIRTRAFSASENSHLMRTVAEILDDKAARDLAHRYTELSFESGGQSTPDVSDARIRFADETRDRILNSFVARADRLLAETRSSAATY